MDIRTITDSSAAAQLAADRHEALRGTLPFLPKRSADYFEPRIAWMIREGQVLGLYDDRGMAAFYGDFILENFRNLGPGAFSPDWSHGHRHDADPFSAYRLLYREAARLRLKECVQIHSASYYASELHALEAFVKTGFGHIVMDAARPSADIAKDLASTQTKMDSKLSIRRALIADADSLERLNAHLAAHIGDVPVCMPDCHGEDAAGWTEWLSKPDSVALLAEVGTKTIAFIKAEDPQFDVSDAVHTPDCLAIDGLFVEKAYRGLGVASALLRNLTAFALSQNKALMSVDCETMNLEAYAFWTRYFLPVAWGMERRI